MILLMKPISYIFCRINGGYLWIINLKEVGFHVNLFIMYQIRLMPEASVYDTPCLYAFTYYICVCCITNR